MRSCKPLVLSALFLSGLFFFTPSAARAVDWKSLEPHLFVEPEFSVLYGEQFELLFLDGTNNSEGLVSKLEWQERMVKLYGGKVGAGLYGFGAEFQILSAIRGRSGLMYDSDWLNFDNVKTHFSVNENMLDSCFRLSFMTYYDFHPFRSFRGFSIAPTAEFTYKNLLFSSENIAGWYGKLYDDGSYAPWNSDAAIPFPNKYGYLCGVDYEKIVFSTFAGLRLKLDLFDRLHILLGGAVSPFSHYEGEDKHFTHKDRRSFVLYKDYANSFFKAFKGNFSTFFDINDILSVGLNGEGLLGLTVKGPMDKLPEDGTWRRLENNQGGFSEYCFQIGAGIRVNIF